MGKNGRPKRCKGVKTDGSPCRSRIVRTSGYCLRHDPDPAAVALAAAASLRGGAATRARRQGVKKLHDYELPELTSPAAAEAFAAVVARAVATGRLSATAANASIRALAEWRTVSEYRRLAAEIKALAEGMTEWQRTGDPSALHKLIERHRKRSGMR